MQNLNVPFGFLANKTGEVTGAELGDMFSASGCSSRTRLTSLSSASDIRLRGEYPISLWIFVSGFQVDLELPVVTWFLALRCAETEVIVVVLWVAWPSVYLWLFRYFFVPRYA